MKLPGIETRLEFDRQPGTLEDSAVFCRYYMLRQLLDPMAEMEACRDMIAAIDANS